MPTNGAVSYCHHMIPTPLFSAFGPKVSVPAGPEATLKSASSATTQEEKSNAHDRVVELATFGISE